jgi:D-beta-D-heptose 7-phosphate kinase/D-beta-D-heptose 1-phosphate adenosyltransferase
MRGPLIVIGDAMLDIDLEGDADRLMPDAPVPVLDNLVETARPGGAALAAAMAARDGHDVVLITALGDDEAGERLEQLLDGVEVCRLRYDGATSVKQRVRADGQSLLRLDSGGCAGRITESADGWVALGRAAAAVLVSDYGRGMTSLPGLREALGLLPQRVAVTWDPHPRGSHPVAGARLVTPNEAEATTFGSRLGVEVPPGTSGLAAVGRRADGLVSGWEAQAVAVTLGKRGALLSYGDGVPVVTPAPSVHCIDSCGAGDRFAVTAALSLGEGQLTTEAVHAGVMDAAAYVAAGGPAALRSPDRSEASSQGSRTAEEVIARTVSQGGAVVATGGCFDLLHAGHVATLRAARSLGDCLVVCLNSDESVRRLKGPSRPLVPAVDRAKVLEALECVDAVIVFDEDTPVHVLGRLKPHIWAKGGDYAGAQVPESAVLEQWGGQAVILPYLQGRSTTQLVRIAAEAAPSQVNASAAAQPDVNTRKESS